MELQLALDLVTAEQGLRIAREVRDLVDVVELGTPFVFTNPVGVIGEFKNALPGVKILADYKIMDGGEIMASLAYGAGADITTVSARTWDDTIAAALSVAKARGCLLLADMMAVPEREIAARSREMDALGVDYICVHRPVNVRGSASPEQPLQFVRETVRRAKIAVAGGIDLETLRRVVPYKPDLVIAGGSITSAADPREMVTAMRKIMEGEK